MPVGLVLLLQLGSISTADFDLARHGPGGDGPSLSVSRRCGSKAGGEVVVCARRADRHRLPLPVDVPPSDRRDGLSAAAAITPAGRCGIFAGERRCGKAEAAGYGYGEGRDPITALGKVLGAVVDPE